MRVPSSWEKDQNIFETNADAHKKKQESLSPEDRDLFEKKITAAQHKHRKSLSLEQQGQIKSTDAAAHKKKYELLPPEKKARCMEIRTEQCHEHLTE
jgi:hypothetical protein